MQTATQSQDKSTYRSAPRVWCLALFSSLLLLSACSVMPRAIVNQEAWDQANQDIQRIAAEQEAPIEAVSLYEAMARAVKFNRERRVKLMERAFADRQYDVSAYDMLPELAASAGYEGRSPELASSSESVETRLESLEPSTSQDKRRKVADVTFSWDLLDFGVSYFRAKQSADRYLISLERERKAVQLLLRDVRKAWWDALSAQRLIKEIDPMTAKVEAALERSSRIEAVRLQKPMEALTYQRSLLQILKTLKTIRKDLAGAKMQLATLMGLPPGLDFRLADPGNDLVVPEITWDNAAMEQAAMVMRPELKQVRYEGKITREDVRVALLGILPNVVLDAGWNWDNNSFLVDKDWMSYGAQVNWNLFQLFRGPKAMKVAKAKQDVVHEQRLALSMAVLMQTHLAKVNYLEADRLYMLSKRYLDVQSRILNQLRATAGTLEGEHALIREELNQLVAEVRHDQAYSALQDSYGRLLVSLGVDVVPPVVTSHTVSDLAGAIRDNIQEWRGSDLRERLGLVDAPEAAEAKVGLPAEVSKAVAKQPAQQAVVSRPSGWVPEAEIMRVASTQRVTPARLHDSGVRVYGH